MGYVADPVVPTKECGTPDAEYSFTSNGQVVRFGVYFPTPLVAPEDEAAFFAEMHAAMVPVIERLYERQWRYFAGTRDKEGRLYPQTYAELWPKATP